MSPPLGAASIRAHAKTRRPISFVPPSDLSDVLLCERMERGDLINELSQAARDHDEIVNGEAGHLTTLTRLRLALA